MFASDFADGSADGGFAFKCACRWLGDSDEQVVQRNVCFVFSLVIFFVVRSSLRRRRLRTTFASCCDRATTPATALRCTATRRSRRSCSPSPRRCKRSTRSTRPVRRGQKYNNDNNVCVRVCVPSAGSRARVVAAAQEERGGLAAGAQFGLRRRAVARRVRRRSDATRRALAVNRRALRVARFAFSSGVECCSRRLAAPAATDLAPRNEHADSNDDKNQTKAPLTVAAARRRLGRRGALSCAHRQRVKVDIAARHASALCVRVCARAPSRAWPLLTRWRPPVQPVRCCAAQ